MYNKILFLFSWELSLTLITHHEKVTDKFFIHPWMTCVRYFYMW